MGLGCACTISFHELDKGSRLPPGVVMGLTWMPAALPSRDRERRAILSDLSQTTLSTNFYLISVTFTVKPFFSSVCSSCFIKKNGSNSIFNTYYSFNKRYSKTMCDLHCLVCWADNVQEFSYFSGALASLHLLLAVFSTCALSYGVF